MAESTQVLEINLISAQGLNRHKKIYAIAWINSSTKLRTQIDRVGGENPTWNDKFLFKVSPEFLSGVTSAVSVEIYSAGSIFRKKLIGTVRILISSFLPTARTSPAFAAFLIRRPSGEFSGILNVGAIVQNTFSCLRALSKVSGIDYRALGGEKVEEKRCVMSRRKKSKGTVADIPLVHESLIWALLNDLRLKQSVENISKKSIWRYSMNVLRFKINVKVNCKFNL